MTTPMDSFELEDYEPQEYEPDHVSHSQLSLWEDCPRKWEFSYVKKLPRSSSDALIIGNVYHHVLEENFKAKMKLGFDLDSDIWIDILLTYWEEQVKSQEQIRWNKYSEEQALSVCTELATRYMEDFAPSITPVEVEKWLSGYIGNTKFVLRMDLLTDAGIIIDHKTAARAYKQDDVDKDNQATATAFALNKNIVFYNHIAVKTRTPYIQAMRTIRTRTDIEWWYRKAEANIAHMKTGYAPPREHGWLCTPLYCDYYDECRKGLYSTTFNIGGIDNDND